MLRTWPDGMRKRLLLLQHLRHVNQEAQCRPCSSIPMIATFFTSDLLSGTSKGICWPSATARRQLEAAKRTLVSFMATMSSVFDQDSSNALHVNIVSIGVRDAAALSEWLASLGHRRVERQAVATRPQPHTFPRKCKRHNRPTSLGTSTRDAIQSAGHRLTGREGGA